MAERCRDVHRAFTWAFTGALILALSGCDLLLPYEASSTARDARSDTRPRDGQRGPAADGPAATSDSARRDGGVVPDRLQRPEATLSDVAFPEVGAPDTGLPGACRLPAVAVPWQANMVLCELPQGSGATQCEAVTHCGTGWHLCTASEYRANGGQAGGPPAMRQFWLAACAREHDAVFAPLDRLCDGACATTMEASLPAVWKCPGGITAPGSTVHSFLGVATNSQCLRVGEDRAQTEAFWTVLHTAAPVAGAVCCR